MNRLGNRLKSAVIVVLLIILGLSKVQNTDTSYIVSKPAHMEFTDEAYVKIYEDSSKDLALYFNEAYAPPIPDVGSSVYDEYGVKVGTIISKDTYSFVFAPSKSIKITQGYSGMRIYYNSNYVGFISSSDLNNNVKVICY